MIGRAAPLGSTARPNPEATRWQTASKLRTCMRRRKGRCAASAACCCFCSMAAPVFRLIQSSSSASAKTRLPAAPTLPRAKSAAASTQSPGPIQTMAPVASTPQAADLAREARDALVARGEHDVGDPLYVGGASRLAAGVDPGSTARLLELLEHQVEVVSLVRDLLDDEGSRVSIGSENPLDELRDCSIVVAPYTVDGEVA